MKVGRELVAEQARDRGGNRNHLFSSWLKKHGFGGIDKAALSTLRACMENRDAIEQWRQNIGAAAAARLNHPQTVMRKWRAATAAGPKKPRRTLKEEVAALQAEVDELRDTLASGDAGRRAMQLQRERDDAVFELDRAERELDLVLRNENLDEAARILAKSYGDDARELAELILAAVIRRAVHAS